MRMPLRIINKRIRMLGTLLEAVLQNYEPMLKEIVLVICRHNNTRLHSTDVWLEVMLRSQDLICMACAAGLSG